MDDKSKDISSVLNADFLSLDPEVAKKEAEQIASSMFTSEIGEPDENGVRTVMITSSNWNQNIDPIDDLLEEHEGLEEKVKVLTKELSEAKDRAYRAECDADSVRKNFFALLHRLENRTVGEAFEDLCDVIARRIFT